MTDSVSQMSEKKSVEFRTTFSHVMEAYETARSAQVSHPRRVLMSDSGPGRVAPSTVDFICDVELAALRTLNSEDFRVFKTVYCDQEEISMFLRRTEVFKHIEDRIMRIVGRAFKQRGISSANYFKPVYITRKKR